MNVLKTPLLSPAGQMSTNRHYWLYLDTNVYIWTFLSTFVHAAYF